MSLKDVITPFKVGLLVLAAVGATLFMVARLTSQVGVGAGDGLALHAVFDDVTGLAKGSRIRMAGVPVGVLQDIELMPTGAARVDVIVDTTLVPVMYQGIPGPERAIWQGGATITKKQASFIGDFYLEITPGTRGEKLDDGEQIMNVISPPGIGEIFETFDDITQDIKKLTESLAAVFGGEQGAQKLELILSSVQEILNRVNTTLAETTPKLDAILTDTKGITSNVERLTDEGGESITATLADAEAAMGDIRRIIGQAEGDVQSGIGTLKGALARLQTTLDSLNYSLQNIQDITDKVNEGEGTLGALVNDPAISDKTEQILDDLSSITTPLAELKTIIQLRSEYHIGPNQFKNVVGLRLQPNRNKYYLIELIDDFRGDTNVSSRDVYTTDPSRDGLYRETVVETTDTFKFSFIYAQIFPVTDWLAIAGRFGFIESTGGAGVEFLLLDDRSLQIQADLFDFGFDISPRVRAFASYYFLQQAYILAGVDDILNDGSRSFYVGGGIRFTDDDLKALITTTGVPIAP